MKLKILLILLILNILLISSIFSKNFPLIKNNEIIGYLFYSLECFEEINKTYYNGYYLNLQEIHHELNYLPLGAIRNYSKIQELFVEIGSYIKKLGFDFVVLGNLRTLSNETEDVLNYVARSPYLVSEVHFRMIRGLEISGIIPIIEVKINDNKNAVESLKQKSGSFFSFSSEIENVDLFFSEEKVIINTNVILELPWIFNSNNLDNMIKYIYEHSIISSGHRDMNEEILYQEINYSDFRKITYFSKDVEELAIKILNREMNPTGNKNW